MHFMLFEMNKMVAEYIKRISFYFRPGVKQMAAEKKTSVKYAHLQESLLK